MKKKKKRGVLHRNWKEWTQKDENLLRKLYPDKFNHELVEHFGRTASAICAKAHLLGIKKNWRKYDSSLVYDRKLWTRKEIKRLEELYPVMPIQKLAPRFPKRSRATIVTKANSLGLRKNYLNHFVQPDNSTPNLWREQKDLLTKLYPTMSNKELAKKFGRTETAIRATAWRIGLHKAGFVPGERTEKVAKLWSKEEDALVRKLYPTAWTKDLAAQLGRTKSSVIYRAGALGIRKDPEKYTPPPTPRTWSDKDTKKLRQLWDQGHKIAQIAEIIGKNQRSVAHKIEQQRRDFGLQKRRNARSWSTKEDEFLIRHYHKKSHEQISTKLGRTKQSIHCRAVVLKITRPNQYRWTDGDIKKLRRLWQKGHTMAQIAETIGKTTASVAHQIQRQKRDFALPEKHDPNRWPKKQTAYLIKHYKNKSARQIGNILGRTPGSIFSKARKLKLSESAPKEWTTSEINFLIRYYKRWTAAKIAGKLGRTLSAVQTRARRLGLKKQ